MRRPRFAVVVFPATAINVYFNGLQDTQDWRVGLVFESRPSIKIKDNTTVATGRGAMVEFREKLKLILVALDLSAPVPRALITAA